MSERIEIDCRGVRASRPVVEIAKAARTYPPATILSIRSDDLTIEEDVRAWASTAKATIMRIEKKEAEILIDLQLPG